VTSEEREKAITYCLCEAYVWEQVALGGFVLNSQAIDLYGEDARVSVCALRTSPPEGLRSYMANDYLEAASLLADGWSPGDPVVRL